MVKMRLLYRLSDEDKKSTCLDPETCLNTCSIGRSTIFFFPSFYICVVTQVLLQQKTLRNIETIKRFKLYFTMSEKQVMTTYHRSLSMAQIAVFLCSY